MKKIITTCFILFSVCYLQAQNLDTISKKMYWWQLAVGGGVNNANNMNRELNTPTISSQGRTVKYENFSSIAGVRLGGTRNLVEGLMIGANLTYDMLSPQTITGVAKIGAMRYGGNITVGPTFEYKGLLFNPYLGAGYAIETLTVENISATRTVAFDLDNPIPVGEKKEYTTDYVLFDLGLGIKKVFSQNLAIGVDGGVYFSPTYGGAWKDGSVEVTSRKAPGSNGGFVRLTFAYGRFKK